MNSGEERGRGEADAYLVKKENLKIRSVKRERGKSRIDRTMWKGKRGKKRRSSKGQAP